MDFYKALIRRIKRILSQRRTILSLAGLLAGYVLLKKWNTQTAAVKLSYFLLALSENKVSEVVVSGNTLNFLSNSTWYKTDTSLLTKDRLFKLLREKESLTFSSKLPADLNDSMLNQIMVFGSSLLLGFLFVNYLDIGGSKGLAPKDYNSSLKSNIKFSDVYGLNFAKKELQEIIDFLRDPEKYENIGARLRRGVLIYGPPGTGKTLLAKATAGESNSSFLYCTASEFVEIYVGMGQKRVRELFNQARKCSPCIIFIDEIDGIGMRREKNYGAEQGGADMERSATLNQLLAEMDGFRENEKIIVIAATNRVLCLDDALLRSGRFDTKIKVELPNEEERFGIIKLHIMKKKQNVTDDVMKQISVKSKGYSGADLENIVNESAYIAIQNKRNVVINDDLEESFSKIKSQKEAKQNG